MPVEDDECTQMPLLLPWSLSIPSLVRSTATEWELQHSRQLRISGKYIREYQWMTSVLSLSSFMLIFLYCHLSLLLYLSIYHYLSLAPYYYFLFILSFFTSYFPSIHPFVISSFILVFPDLSLNLLKHYLAFIFIFLLFFKFDLLEHCIHLVFNLVHLLFISTHLSIWVEKWWEHSELH